MLEIAGAYFYDDGIQPRHIVPVVMIKEVVAEIHKFGHFGHKRTLNMISKFYYWPKMNRDVFHHVKYCTHCQKNKRVIIAPRKFMKLPVTSRFRTIHIDLVGPLKQSATKKKYILTIMDRFSRWPEGIPLANIKAETVARRFYTEWICRYGVPDYIISDQGSQFESAVFQEMLKTLDIKRRRTTAYHPQANGMIERVHGVIKNTLRCFTDRFSDWEKALPTVLFAIRTAVNNLGISPSLIMYGEHIAIPGVFTFPSLSFNEDIEEQFVIDLTNHWLQVRDFVLENDPVLSIKPGPSMPNKYPHDYVWIKEPLFKGSLYPKARGPYKVIGSNYPVIYIKNEGVEQTVNVDRCRPAYILQRNFLNQELPEPTWAPSSEVGPVEENPRLLGDVLQRSVGRPCFPSEGHKFDIQQPTVLIDPFDMRLIKDGQVKLTDGNIPPMLSEHESLDEDADIVVISEEL